MIIGPKGIGIHRRSNNGSFDEPLYGPRGKGYFIREVIKQKGNDTPRVQYHVTLDGKPIDTWIPIEHSGVLGKSETIVVGNPYASEEIAKKAIEFHKSWNAPTVIVSDKVYDENMNELGVNSGCTEGKEKEGSTFKIVLLISVIIITAVALFYQA